MSRYRVLFAAAFLLSCAACRREPTLLQPAERSQEVFGSAMDVVAGIEVRAEGAAWTGEPQTLGAALTPVRVTVENGSGRALRLRYSEFALLGPDDRRFAALPPFDPSEAAPSREPALSPAFDSTRFQVAPWGSRIYGPAFSAWREPFDQDRTYYERHRGAWDAYGAELQTELPTEDMLSRAIPEGVIESGGRVSGFVYFEKVGTEIRAVRFHFDLVDARTGETFGTVAIPFTVHEVRR